jgi:two-component system cell cycle response regulator CpdR
MSNGPGNVSTTIDAEPAKGSSYPKMKILVAEDEQHAAMLYSVVLRNRGHTVKITADGESCLSAYMEELAKTGVGRAPFDAVVLDHRMPKKSGFEVAREILARIPSQRIIFTSAFAAEVLGKSLNDLEPRIEVIYKPFGMDALVRVLEEGHNNNGGSGRPAIKAKQP